MATPPLLRLDGISLSFGGTPLLEGAGLSVAPGERLCLVGRNGSGKSTLLKIAAGLVESDSGERFLQPGATVRYLPQEPDLSRYDTVLSYVEDGLSPTDDPHRARYLLEHLGLDTEADPETLSGGEKRRAALARVLAPRPEVLLLDEPTNHLDLPTIEWLEEELKGLNSALVLISHDRRFLERLGQAVIWLDRGRTRRMDAGFEKFEAWREEIIEQEQVEREKLDKKIDAETSWLHKGVTARRKRNMGRLRALQDLRKQRREQRSVTGTVSMTASEAGTSGKRVIEAKNLNKSFDGKTVVKDFSTRILRGDRVGFVGPNGAGKTTLLRMLTGELEPDSGTVKHGTALEMATLDQGRKTLDPNDTLQDALTGGSGSDRVTVNGQTRHVMSYMKDFLFAPEQARTPIERLSGGERGRLMLARALARPSNLLVLDEPTNDLDLETLDLLQELIADYAGTVLLVSHDRDFLDRTVTSVIHHEGNGNWVEYAGGYSDMLAQRGSDAPKSGTAGKPAKKQKSKQDTRKPAGDSKRSKLSFTERHKLEDLPDQMEKLEATIAALQETLAAPDLFAKDPDAFQKATDALSSATDALEKAEEEWLRLEALREEEDG